MACTCTLVARTCREIYLNILLQMTEQMSEMNELKRQLASSAAEQSRLADLNTQQQASTDALQQQLMQLKAQHESADSQLTDSKALISQLQASMIFCSRYLYLLILRDLMSVDIKCV